VDCMAGITYCFRAWLVKGLWLGMDKARGDN